MSAPARPASRGPAPDPARPIARGPAPGTRPRWNPSTQEAAGRAERTRGRPVRGGRGAPKTRTADVLVDWPSPGVSLRSEVVGRFCWRGERYQVPPDFDPESLLPFRGQAFLRQQMPRAGREAVGEWKGPWYGSVETEFLLMCRLCGHGHIICFIRPAHRFFQKAFRTFLGRQRRGAEWTVSGRKPPRWV